MYEDSVCMLHDLLCPVGGDDDDAVVDRNPVEKCQCVNGLCCVCYSRCVCLAFVS